MDRRLWREAPAFIFLMKCCPLCTFHECALLNLLFLQQSMSSALSQAEQMCVHAEESKPLSYKLKEGEIDAPDPTPQRSGSGEDNESSKSSGEEGNGGGDTSEEDSEDEGGNAEDKEKVSCKHGALSLACCIHAPVTQHLLEAA